MQSLSSVQEACKINYPSLLSQRRCVGVLTNSLESAGYDKSANPVTQKIISGSCHRSCKKRDGTIGDKCFLDCVIAGNIAFSGAEPIKEGYSHPNMTDRRAMMLMMILVLVALLIWVLASNKK